MPAHQRINRQRIKKHERNVDCYHDVDVDILHQVVDAEAASLEGEADEGTLKVLEPELQELVMQMAFVGVEGREPFGNTHAENSDGIQQREGNKPHQDS